VSDLGELSELEAPGLVPSFLGRAFVSLRKYRNYRLYFIGQFISLAGSWMQDTALSWLVFDLTHSTFDVGILVFVRFLPLTLFTPFAGVLADRFDNRRALIAINAASMVIAAALAVIAYDGAASLDVVYALAFLSGVVAVFYAPNRLAFTFQLVDREDLPNAVALNSSLLNTTRVIGPAVAGVVIAVSGAAACFAANAVSYVAALAALLAMHPSELVSLNRGGERPAGLRAIREGVAFVRRQPMLWLILLMTGVIGIVGFNFRVTLPLLASDTLHGGPGTFGFLYACFGAGALAGALAAAAWPEPSGRRLQLTIVGFGVALLAIAPLHSTALVSLLLVVTGVCSALWTTTSQSILQLSTPDRLRGRVLSLYWFVFAGLTPLGALLVGWLATRGGSELVFAVAGLVSLVMGGYVIWRMRRLTIAAH
jgi:MFS family permease